jgi:hypothetical protein
MGKWFQVGVSVRGISGYAQTEGKEGIIVKGRDDNGKYIVRWNDGTTEGVTIDDIASCRRK